MNATRGEKKQMKLNELYRDLKEELMIEGDPSKRSILRSKLAGIEIEMLEQGVRTW